MERLASPIAVNYVILVELRKIIPQQDVERKITTVLSFVDFGDAVLRPRPKVVTSLAPLEERKILLSSIWYFGALRWEMGDNYRTLAWCELSAVRCLLNLNDGMRRSWIPF